jgi:hypothetical protein
VTSNTPSTSIRGHADPLSRALRQNGYGQNMKVGMSPAVHLYFFNCNQIIDPDVEVLFYTN